MLQVTEEWEKMYPEASVGLMLLSGAVNPEYSEALECCKRELEAKIRSRFPSRREIIEFEPIRVYSAYYKGFGKTYHVQHQLESVAVKGKTIPQGAGLVEAMFMAELKNGLLTAGHDYQALTLPLKLTVATGEEEYVLINGKEQTAKSSDMIITDGENVISSIIYGPDQRTRIHSDTKQAVFLVYAPAGIASATLESHLHDIYSFVRFFAPTVKIEAKEIFRSPKMIEIC